MPANRPIESGFLSGKVLYVVRHNPDGRVWNTNTTAWESYNSAHWINYAISLTEQTGSGYYHADQTIANLDVLTTDVLYQQINDVPVLPSSDGGDVLIGLGQSQGVDLFALNGSADPVTKLAASTGTMRVGLVQAGANTPATALTNLTESTTDIFKGRVLVFVTGNLAPGAAFITAYNGTTKALSFTPLPGTPGTGDEFVIV